MAKGYASRLTKGIDYGECGLPERVDNGRVMENKIKTFVDLIKKSKYIVWHTGAGTNVAKECAPLTFSKAFPPRVVYLTFVGPMVYGQKVFVSHKCNIINFQQKNADKILKGKTSLGDQYNLH